MATKRTLKLTPEHARVPQALPAFILLPDRPPVYHGWRRLLDVWAGMRHRSPGAREDGEVPVADSPWLQRLLAECAASIAVGRTRTDALVAILDKDAAALRAEIDILQGHVQELEGAHEAASAAPVSDAIVGPGEEYSPPVERLQRREWAKAERVARAKASVSAAEARLRAARQELSVLEQERRSHWSVLQERTRLLVEHYQRRAASYTQGLERRRRRVFFVTPTVPLPAWVRPDLGTGGVESAPVLSLQPAD